MFSKSLFVITYVIYYVDVHLETCTILCVEFLVILCKCILCEHIISIIYGKEYVFDQCNVGICLLDLQRVLDGPHRAGENLDISNISRDSLNEMNAVQRQPTTHTFETFRRAKLAPPLPPLSVDKTNDRKSPTVELSLENEIMAALNSCRVCIC